VFSLFTIIHVRARTKRYTGALLVAQGAKAYQDRAGTASDNGLVSSS